mgnify:FL=1
MQQHWDDVRVFLAVARAASLSGAGKHLRIDPATVGRRIARLELEIATALFVKSPQGYVLTNAGQRLMERAETVEAAMQAASDVLNTTSEELSGQIRLGAPDGCAKYLLPQVCAANCADHPDLDIQIVALPRVFNLSKREADMAIGVSAPTANRLHVQKLTDYKLHLMAARPYLRSHPPIQTVRDLQNHRVIGYIPDMIFDTELDYLNDLGIKRVALASNTVSVQFNIVRHGGGI